MSRLLSCCALLLLTVASAWAAEPAPSADPTLAKALESANVKFKVDQDGDYEMTFDMGEGRTQLVFARSPVETFGGTRVREIWSPGYRYSTPELDAKVANRLLLHSAEMIMGGWIRQKSAAVFVVKIAADATPAQLRDALEAAAAAADQIEQELTPGTDEL